MSDKEIPVMLNFNGWTKIVKIPEYNFWKGFVKHDFISKGPGKENDSEWYLRQFTFERTTEKVNQFVVF
jgi:hypothetical protein